MTSDGGHDGSEKPPKYCGQDSMGEDSSIPKGPPITATANTWTWVPFPDSACANGTATGIGVNLTGTPSSRVLIYLEGGGACWDDLTCYTLMTATNFTTGYGETNFTADSLSELAVPGGFFDRTASANPFQDYSYVYVPYCTGDQHMGDAPAVAYGSNTAKQVGFANMTAFLNRIVPTFPHATEVVISGSSEGGFG